jgi:hypothetical protein
MREGGGHSESGKPVGSAVAKAEEPRLQARFSNRALIGIPLSELTPWDTEPEEMTGRPCSLPPDRRR